MPPVCNCHEIFHNIFLKVFFVARIISSSLALSIASQKISAPDPGYIMQILSKTSKVNRDLGWLVWAFLVLVFGGVCWLLLLLFGVREVFGVFFVVVMFY